MSHITLILGMKIIRAVPEKKNMGVFVGNFILPPPLLRFNYCLCPPRTLSNY